MVKKMKNSYADPLRTQ